MLTLLRKIFTWWNQDTFGTRLKTIFFGKLVGTDHLGNKYYESKNGKRWVIYSNTIDASKFLLNGILGYILHQIKLRKNIYLKNMNGKNHIKKI